MASQAPLHIDELEARLVVRAQTGDRAAFSELYRRHAHPAWRLALAVGGSAPVAEKAVVQGFTAALRRLKRGTTTMAMPFRLHVARASAEAAAAAARRDGAPVDPAPNDLVTAFRRLPERWRAGLWLTAVEGGNPGQVAPVLALSAEATVSLVTRAALGLRERYLRIEGEQLDDVREAVPALRALVVPIPDAVQDRAMGQWQAWQDEMAKDERHGLAAMMPLGAWAERAVAGAAAGIFAAGLACAIALTSGPKGHAPQLAAPAAAAQPLKNATGTNRLTLNTATAIPPSTGSMFIPDLSHGGGRPGAAAREAFTAASAGAAVPTSEPAFVAASSSPAGQSGQASPSSSSSPSQGAPAGPLPPVAPPPGPPQSPSGPAPAPPPLPPVTTPPPPVAPQGSPSTTLPPAPAAPSGGTTVVTIVSGVLPPVTVALP